MQVKVDNLHLELVSKTKSLEGLKQQKFDEQVIFVDEKFRENLKKKLSKLWYSSTKSLISLMQYYKYSVIENSVNTPSIESLYTKSWALKLIEEVLYRLNVHFNTIPKNNIQDENNE